jgi:hypothetical protein
VADENCAVVALKGWPELMRGIDAVAFVAAVNADPEFRLAARHWNAKVGLNVPPDNLVLAFENGALIDAGPGDPATADIRLTAPEGGWLEFLKPVPSPFHHGMLPAIVRQGFALDGDVVLWTTYYGALSRVFAVMKTLVNGQAIDGSI